MKGVMDISSTADRTLSFYIERALKSSKTILNYNGIEYNELSSLLLGVLNARLQIIEQLFSKHFTNVDDIINTKNDNKDFIDRLLKPIHELYIKWYYNKISSENESPIHEYSDPPKMLVEPNYPLKVVYEGNDMAPFNHLTPSTPHLSLLVASHFLDNLAQSLQLMRNSFVSNTESVHSSSKYYSKLPLHFAFQQHFYRRNNARTLREIINNHLPYLSSYIDDSLFNSTITNTEKDMNVRGSESEISLIFKTFQLDAHEKTEFLSNLLEKVKNCICDGATSDIDKLYAYITILSSKDSDIIKSFNNKKLLSYINIDKIFTNFFDNDSQEFVNPFVKESLSDR